MDPALQPSSSSTTERSANGALGPLLAATDGTEESAVALRAARLLGGHLRGDVNVVTVAVFEPPPMLSSEIQLPAWAVDFAAAQREEVLRRARAQVAAEGEAARGGKLELREGAAAREITAVAREVKAQLVLVGLGKHGLSDRLFGDETVLQLLPLAHVPILALPPTFDELPRRAVIATDFSAASVRAARVALRLLQPDATVYLVHVIPRYALLTGVWEALQSSYADELSDAFATLQVALDVPASMRVETVTLMGTPARELLAFATATQSDLIAAGSHGHGFFSRLIVGSVASRLIRNASCAVLVVPPPVNVMREEQEQGWTPSVRAEEWPRLLEALTQRNALRQCSIEIDDPELGAQAQALDYPLLGISFDRRDRRVDIMLGEIEGARRHLTHSIGGVSEIDVSQDRAGHDRMIRIAHGRGQTLITFVTSPPARDTPQRASLGSLSG